MDMNDRQVISALFDKLAIVERQVPARDAEAEACINAAVARQPGAPDCVAQTVAVREHALSAARTRIEQLKAELANGRTSRAGGFLSGLFGDRSAPLPPARATGRMPQGAPGWFLAGARQTAVGVAGGMLLANALGGMFAGPAEADVPHEV